MREVADVHRGLFDEYGDSYGDNVRTKIQRCLAVGDDAYGAALRRREEYRALVDELLDGLDLLLTPTLAFVAPKRDVEELDFRERLIHFTYPFNVTGRPALALPCGAAEDGLPASVQLIGRPGDDSLVLAAGERLERALSGG
jgi:Asp-tRNA(Asn)/Glu-tRNA(Gln) amidotransferase A subunit family amidase